MGWSLGLGSLPVACLLLVGSLLRVGTQERSREVPCQGLGYQGEAYEVHCKKARYNCWVDNLQASFVLGAHRLLALGVLPFSCLDAAGGQGVHQAAVHLACHPC